MTAIGIDIVDPFSLDPAIQLLREPDVCELRVRVPGKRCRYLSYRLPVAGYRCRKSLLIETFRRLVSY